MAETPPAVLAYVNPQDNPPPYSFISVEQLSDRLVVVAPGVGALRYGADLLLHVLFMYLFLSAAVFIVLEFVKVDRPPWAYLLVPVALLALVIHSFARLMRVAVRPTRFELHEGMLKITGPLSAPREWPVHLVENFAPQTTGITLGFRPLGSLRLHLVDRMPVTLMRRYYHAEVVWLARLLNQELARQRPKSPEGGA
jgi:hypothetical protein